MSTNERRTILLVEDEAVLALAQKTSLEKYGYHVRMVHNGEDAVTVAADDSSVDLILMDINLGSGIDGTEAAMRILARRSVPLIFVSSHTDRAIVEKTEGITSYGYVVKNAGITVLDAAIKMAFRLFNAQVYLRRQKMEVEATNETLRITNDELERSRERILNRERELQEWRGLMEYVIHHDPGAIAILDTDLVFRFVSERFLQDYRVRETDVVGLHHYEVFPEIPDRWREVHQRALKGEVIRSEYDFFERPDGTTDYTRWECRPWYEVGGKIGGIILYTEVITDRELAAGRFRRLVENSPDIIYSFSSTRGGLYWSKRVRDILGYDPDEIMADPFLWNRSIHPEDRPAVQQAIEDDRKGARYAVEYRIRTRDGRWMWLRDQFIHKAVTDDEVIIDGQAKDITARKVEEELRRTSEDQIRTLLQEKDLLLREVHHRIKNNMNTMVSLLSLQANAVTDTETTRILEEAGGRLQAMQVLYDRLYRTENLRDMSLRDYLPDLIAEILRLFPLSERILLETEVDDVILTVQQLSCLGIIVNELVTNAVKYALAGRDRARLSVTARHLDGHVTLTVADDGPGIPAPTIDGAGSGGFGLTIVGALAEQLRGELTIDDTNGDGGARVVVSFET